MCMQPFFPSLHFCASRCHALHAWFPEVINVCTLARTRMIEDRRVPNTCCCSSSDDKTTLSLGNVMTLNPGKGKCDRENKATAKAGKKEERFRNSVIGLAESSTPRARSHMCKQGIQRKKEKRHSRKERNQKGKHFLEYISQHFAYISKENWNKMQTQVQPEIVFPAPD